MITMAYVAHTEAYQIAGAQLALVPRLNSASSRGRRCICNRTRIAQISLSLIGVFWPTSLSLFQASC